VFSILFIFLFGFIVGGGAIAFSVIAWRTRNETWFWVGVGFLATMLIIIAVNIKLLMWMFTAGSGATLYALVIFACAIIPVAFLIAAKTKPSYGTGSELTDDYVGGSTGNSGPVSQEYLDEIINSPDDEIKFDT
jgi:hypothetical protein